MPLPKSATAQWDRGYVVLIGGARSGKSRAAVELAAASQRAVVFIATATAGDDDMASRIANHQAERPATWTTIEAPNAVADAVAMAPGESFVVVDCVTLWASNLLLGGIDEQGIAHAAVELADALAERDGPSVIVTNEVGLGLVPEYELGRAYRDALGRANVALVAQSRRSAFLIAGRAVALHDLDEVLA
jgi:adenosylcobinamide kinase / adenosylcobinamide-phosphate guanylyltransferase